MNVISIVSMKGGVGKTTITASLAVALAERLGKNRVAVIGFDPRNSLPWHLGLGNHNGGVSPAEKGLCQMVGWNFQDGNIAYECDPGLVCIPFGEALEAQRKSFEKTLHSDPDGLKKIIARTRLDEDALVLIDTPPGHSVYQQQALQAADFAIAALLPDAGSYATVASMESSLAQTGKSNSSVYVVNQYDQRQALCVDVVRMLRQELGSRLAPILINHDEGVREALAVQKTCLKYDPHSQASHDIDQLCKWLIATVTRSTV